MSYQGKNGGLRQIHGYFEYSNPFTGVAGDGATRKQQSYIDDLLKNPFDRAEATLRLGTLPDASRMSKREASYYIDDIKNKRNEMPVRLKGEAYSTAADELSDVRYMRQMAERAALSGKSTTEFSVRTADAADAYNALSRKYALGTRYSVRKKRR